MDDPRVGRQLILPKIVIVAVGVGPRRVYIFEYVLLDGNIHRVLGLGRDVAINIIGVGGAFLLRPRAFLCQLAEPVVFVGLCL